jgi:hypothetical protein
MLDRDPGCHRSTEAEPDKVRPFHLVRVHPGDHSLGAVFDSAGFGLAVVAGAIECERRDVIRQLPQHSIPITGAAWLSVQKHNRILVCHDAPY